MEYINPFKIKAKELTQAHKEALIEWATNCHYVRSYMGIEHIGAVKSVLRSSVVDSIWIYHNRDHHAWEKISTPIKDSIGLPVVQLVRMAVKPPELLTKDMVREQVWDTAWEAVYGYIGSLFVDRIKKWEYLKDLGENPWKGLSMLWNDGYVPSFNGGSWFLHEGKSAKIAHEQKIKFDNGVIFL